MSNEFNFNMSRLLDPDDSNSPNTFGIDGLEDTDKQVEDGVSDKGVVPPGMDLNAELLALAGTSAQEAAEMVEGLRRAFWEHQNITVARNDPLCAQALWAWLTFEATSKRFEGRLNEATSIAMSRINAATEQLTEAQRSLEKAFQNARSEFDATTLNRTEDFKRATVVFAETLNKTSVKLSDQLIGATQRLSEELVANAEASMAKIQQNNSNNVSTKISSKTLLERAAERFSLIGK